MLKKSCFLLVVMFLTLAQARAETLIIAAENDWVPYAKANGTGMANDIIKEAFALEGINIEYHVYPYARVLHYLKSGRYVAGFNVPFDEESNSEYLLGKTPMYMAESAYYHHLKNPLLAVNRSELKNKELVGVVRDYGYGDVYLEMVQQRKIVPVLSNSESNNIELLTLGRIDSTILYTKTANHFRRNKAMSFDIAKAFTNEQTAIHLAFSRKHEKGKYYLTKFQLGLNKLIASGKRDQILASY